MTQNHSNETTDDRIINQVIYEKALLGRFPAYFQIAGDDRYHPCAWQMHPHLTAVIFSDGTTSHVTAAKPTEAVAEKVGPIPDSYYNARTTAMTTSDDESDYIGDRTNSEPDSDNVAESDYQISTEAIAKLFSPEK